MVRITCITYQCYIWIRGRAGRGRGERGTRTKIILFTVQHHLVSCGISQATDTSYTLLLISFFFLFFFYHKITSLITGPTQHDTPHAGKNHFPFLSAAGSRAKGVGEEGRWLRLRQAGDVSLWRGTIGFAGGAVGLVLEQQDTARKRKPRWIKLHSDCQPKSNFSPLDGSFVAIRWLQKSHLIREQSQIKWNPIFAKCNENIVVRWFQMTIGQMCPGVNSSKHSDRLIGDRRNLIGLPLCEEKVAPIKQSSRKVLLYVAVP